MAMHTTTPIVLAPDGSSSFDVVQLAFRKIQLDGAHPFTRVENVPQAIDVDRVIDDSWTTVSRVSEAHGTVLLAERDGVWLYVAVVRSTRVECAAGTMQEAHRVAQEFSARMAAAVDDEAPEQTSRVQMWHCGRGGFVGLRRSIVTHPWADIEANYSAAPCRAIGDLAQLAPDTVPPGRIILWHGPPGTGKTAAVRALVHEWREWCTAHLVIDSEAFFADPGYIAEVITTGQPKDWKLIIAEDCDDSLVHQPGSGVQGPLGRLLNLTDGLFGQGTNTLVLLTTNTPIDRIHPAITRPGRCLANVEFTTLTPAEVARRTGVDGLPGMSLAEVYQYLAMGHTPVANAASFGYI